MRLRSMFYKPICSHGSSMFLCTCKLWALCVCVLLLFTFCVDVFCLLLLSGWVLFIVCWLGFVVVSFSVDYPYMFVHGFELFECVVRGMFVYV